jgi:aryl-alcohol dehydrogenase-like predicted oxidoreductase
VEYAVITREIEHQTLPTLRALGIGLIAYGVLSRGLIGGPAAGYGAAGDHRTAMLPRFQGENLPKNLELVEARSRIAAAKGVTPAQLAIAWVLAQGEDIFPLVGVRSRQRLGEALGASDVRLSAQDLEQIVAAIPAGAVAGTRYDVAGMALVNR